MLKCSIGCEFLTIKCFLRIYYENLYIGQPSVWRRMSNQVIQLWMEYKSTSNFVLSPTDFRLTRWIFFWHSFQKLQLQMDSNFVNFLRVVWNFFLLFERAMVSVPFNFKLQFFGWPKASSSRNAVGPNFSMSRRLFAHEVHVIW